MAIEQIGKPVETGLAAELGGLQLEGGTIVVTGGASGIGQATARLAARRGARVVVLDTDEHVSDAEDEGVTARRADVTDTASMDAAIGWTVDRFGPITGVVCSAGGSFEVPFLDLTLDQWTRLTELNLTGTFLTAQCVARSMVARNVAGAIVTVSSGQAFSGRAGGAHYSASKAGVVALTKSIARELGPYGIRANCVAPGPVDTPLLRRVVEANPGGLGVVVRAVPLGRIGEPAEVAEAICFLLSGSARWITGETIHVNGGMHMI
jgi:2-hydroxycyclohexanecarboxyl-CoA dehydrogenase